MPRMCFICSSSRIGAPSKCADGMPAVGASDEATRGRAEGGVVTMSSDHDHDLVVLGSGAAGLAAALAASALGARVLLAEKSELIGGTTAMSGGCIWVPNNHLMRAAGLHDSADDALGYIRAVAPDGWAELEEPLWQTFVEQAPEMLSFIERRTSLRFGLGGEPDPYMEAPGARAPGAQRLAEAVSLRCPRSLAASHPAFADAVSVDLRRDHRPSPRRRPEAGPLALRSSTAGADDAGPPRHGSGPGGAVCCSPACARGAWSAPACARSASSLATAA